VGGSFIAPLYTFLRKTARALTNRAHQQRTGAIKRGVNTPTLPFFMIPVAVKSVAIALRGRVVGWGKLERKATAEAGP
jgi:hypothetical protein